VCQINRFQVIFLAFVLNLFFMLSLFAPVQAEESMSKRLVAIKAAYLYRFSLFIDWPEPVLDSFLMCVVADTETSDFIQLSLYNQVIQSKPIRVISVLKEEDLTACQLLYIPSTVKESTPFLVKAKQNILTIGETPDFYHAQGMIYLYEQDNKLRFFINYLKLKKSGLTARAQLMTLSQLPMEKNSDEKKSQTDK